MMVVIGLPLGVLSARYRDSWIDHGIRVVTLLGVSAPELCLGRDPDAAVRILPAAVPDRRPDRRQLCRPSVTGFLLVDTLLAGNLKAFGNAAWHIVLPAFALALSASARRRG
jgi:peptide/nickel transport system permease protein